MSATTVFLLSPAHCGGRRAAMLMRPDAEFELAERFRAGGASLGEVFAFLSGLYFRGKLEYSRRFGRASQEQGSTLVITSSRGLVSPGELMGPPELAEFARVPIDGRDPRYLIPLERSARFLGATLDEQSRVILLGSVATAKYVETLLEHLGDRLHFPEAFIGMGDMQRGALMLRAAAAGKELAYVRARGAVRSRAARRPGSNHADLPD